MARYARLFRATLGVTLAVVIESCSKSGSGGSETPSEAPPATPPAATADLGVDVSAISPAVVNPYVAFGSVKRAVFAGKEYDPETKKTINIRVESTVRDTPETIAGMKVTVVDVTDFDQGELVERTMDYYVQHTSGDVYYVGESVEDLEDGKVVGHGGQWLAGEKGARAGVFMPGEPKVGDVFEQERAPGVAEDRSTVVGVGRSVKTPAGNFTDCIETEDYDPIGKSTQRKFYCKGVGLVKEVTGKTRTVELIELVKR